MFQVRTSYPATHHEQPTVPGAQAWHPAMVVAPHRNMLSSGKGKWYEAVPRRAMLDRLHSVCKRAPSRGVLAGVQSARRRPALQRAIADDFWSDRKYRMGVTTRRVGGEKSEGVTRHRRKGMAALPSREGALRSRFLSFGFS